RTDEHLQKEEINKLIKSSIPGYDPQNSSFNEFSRWKKFYNHIVLLIIENPKLQENNISTDFCFNQFIGLGLIVNYLYQVEEDNFKSFVNEFEQYCIKKYSEKKDNIN
ncbi:9240_t:CDS:1, partial [Racocetra persica]